jgi:hypothetical protein
LKHHLVNSLETFRVLDVQNKCKVLNELAPDKVGIKPDVNNVFVSDESFYSFKACVEQRFNEQVVYLAANARIIVLGNIVTVELKKDQLHDLEVFGLQRQRLGGK